ncbi:Sugar kinase of the NBD/HSP70 family, may contain an N-terminal HTH domain [Actinacidiphila yanglinensis]|uniref:Sugar kinase of the NBD/HSP70 family, may contain an N-terminal HTH domain n=1 Tax=Actinacidiphila yanglinensis TaxID=310779 RepID=A0A1H6B6K4_9ACTN|nr:ROK family transcriptional regulator [Actinacidiphila yanglinensis]SEG55847.1 Sugar kinase of the NBD/HSP70 family, may contain an N-terminal HTH domain [Actinacidiphila yanglinensis]
MTQGGTNLPRVGGYNQAVILDAIRTAGQVSRVELAPLTGLTSQTVSNVVRRLLAAGLITESGHAPSSGGKRRTLLSPRADGAFAVGVQLDPDAAVIVVVDLSGEVLASRRVRLTDLGDPARVVARVAAAARRLTARTRVDPARLLGTGIATPGPIDGTAGEVVLPPNFPGWGRVPLLEMFGAATGMPVAMDNDATVAAIGERWIGGRARAGSFLFIYLGTGIGAGIVLNNTVLHGDSSNAGEFGHMTVEPGDRTCHCGGTNCLGPYVSPAAVLADLTARHGRSAAERIGLAGTDEAVHADWKVLCRAARRGEPAARDVIRTAAARIGQAARGAVALLDVDRVVLGGEALRGIEAIMCEEVDAAVNTTSVARAIRRVSVERSVIGEAVGAVGAASLILHGRYAPGWRMLTQPSP